MPNSNIYNIWAHICVYLCHKHFLFYSCLNCFERHNTRYIGRHGSILDGSCQQKHQLTALVYSVVITFSCYMPKFPLPSPSAKIFFIINQNFGTQHCAGQWTLVPSANYAWRIAPNQTGKIHVTNNMSSSATCPLCPNFCAASSIRMFCKILAHVERNFGTKWW